MHWEVTMTIEDNKDNTVSVNTECFWEDIESCPRSRKVQLLSKYGVAVYGEYYGNNQDNFWTHWAALPKKRKQDE